MDTRFRLTKRLKRRSKPFIFLSLEIAQIGFDMLKIWGTIILSLLCSIGYSQDSLFVKHFLDGKLEIAVPQSLREMSDEEWQYKYSNSKRKASIVLTDSLLTTNLVIMHIQEARLSDDSIGTIIDGQVKKIEARFPTARFLVRNLIDINGKKVAYMKVVSPAEEVSVFNYLVVTNLNGSALVLNFNCIELLMDQWEPIFEKMVASMRLYE